MRLRILAVFVMLFCFALIGGSAWADGVTVQNNSFEQFNALTMTAGCVPGCSYNLGPIPDWSITAGAAGSWQPGASGTYFSQPLPDGSTLAFVNGIISQDLGTALLPDTSYTLTVDVGDRLDGYRGGWSIALDAGGIQMCGNSGLTSNIIPGTFAQETCTFQTGDSIPSGNLIILLGGSGAGDNATFDDVRVSTPEPSTVGLLALGLFFVALIGGLYKRKQGLQSAA